EATQRSGRGNFADVLKRVHALRRSRARSGRTALSITRSGRVVRATVQLALPCRHVGWLSSSASQARVLAPFAAIRVVIVRQRPRGFNHVLRIDAEFLHHFRTGGTQAKPM